MTQDDIDYIEILEDCLIAAENHLDYCGYGDSWERKCAREDNLQNRLRAAIILIEEKKEQRNA